MSTQELGGSPDLKSGVVDGITPTIVLSTASTAPGGKHPGDWTCRSCGYLNFVSRVVCHKCYTPKEHPGKHPGDWICAQCGALCFVSRSSCFKCMSPKQPWVPGFPPPGGRFSPGFPQQHQYKHPGDWCCPRCFDHVYASRTVCRKCNTAKPQQPLIATPSVLGTPPSGPIIGHLSSPPMGYPHPQAVSPQQMRMGDWVCTNTECRTHNFGSRPTCRKCNSPRTEEAVDAVRQQLESLSFSGGFSVIPTVSGTSSPDAGSLPGNSPIPPTHTLGSVTASPVMPHGSLALPMGATMQGIGLITGSPQPPHGALLVPHPHPHQPQYPQSHLAQLGFGLSAYGAHSPLAPARELVQRQSGFYLPVTTMPAGSHIHLPPPVPEHLAASPIQAYVTIAPNSNGNGSGTAAPPQPEVPQRPSAAPAKATETVTPVASD